MKAEAGEISGPPSLLLEACEALEPPKPQWDDAVSPLDVRHTVFEEQAKEAEDCMQYYREIIDKLQDMLEASQPDTDGLATKIRGTLAELSTTIRESARVQNIAECRLQVAASLYVIFKLIIPVM